MTENMHGNVLGGQPLQPSRPPTIYRRDGSIHPATSAVLPSSILDWACSNTKLVVMPFDGSDFRVYDASEAGIALPAIGTIPRPVGWQPSWRHSCFSTDQALWVRGTNVSSGPLAAWGLRRWNGGSWTPVVLPNVGNTNVGMIKGDSSSGVWVWPFGSQAWGDGAKAVIRELQPDGSTSDAFDCYPFIKAEDPDLAGLPESDVVIELFSVTFTAFEIWLTARTLYRPDPLSSFRTSAHSGRLRIINRSLGTVEYVPRPSVGGSWGWVTTDLADGVWGARGNGVDVGIYLLNGVDHPPGSGTYEVGFPSGWIRNGQYPQIKPGPIFDPIESPPSSGIRFGGGLGRRRIS